MRAVLLATLLVLVALSGCSGKDPAGPPVDDSGGRDGRRSVGGGGDGNGTSGPTEDVVLLDAAVKLDATQAEQSFQVTVPVNITSVDAHITAPGPIYQEQDLAMSLDGCGSFSNAGYSSGRFGGAVAAQHHVCGEATPGTHTFRISGGPAQSIEGSIRLIGQRPIANETAVA